MTKNSKDRKYMLLIQNGYIKTMAGEVMGLADRVGSLEPGKDGDVVIRTADPLTTIGGKAAVTIIEGKVVYQG